MNTLHQEICSLRGQLQERGDQSSRPPQQPATNNQAGDSSDINMELSPSNAPGGAAGRSGPGAGTYEDPVRYRVLDPQVPDVPEVIPERGPQEDVDLMTFPDELSLAEEEAALAEDGQGDEAAA